MNTTHDKYHAIGLKVMAYWRTQTGDEGNFDRDDAVSLLLAVKAWIEDEAGLDWRETLEIMEVKS